MSIFPSGWRMTEQRTSMHIFSPQRKICQQVAMLPVSYTHSNWLTNFIFSRFR